MGRGLYDVWVSVHPTLGKLTALLPRKDQSGFFCCVCLLHLDTEVGEPLGRGRLQTDHAQSWNEGRWTALGRPSGFIQKTKKSRNGTMSLKSPDHESVD
jgi:hypothetical protein